MTPPSTPEEQFFCVVCGDLIAHERVVLVRSVRKPEDRSLPVETCSKAHTLLKNTRAMRERQKQAKLKNVD